MAAAHVVRQPRSFDRFRCIGAECEDTCCKGWGILVDSETWEKYQQPHDFRVAGKPLSSLVEINPASCSSIDYAKIRLEGTGCPALHEGLCSIQQALGEHYIPDLCSTYPRVLNRVGATFETSLHLSCPEAARLILSDPEAMILSEGVEDSLPHRAGSLSAILGSGDESLTRVRALAIEVIRERSVPLWQRIVSLEFAIDRIADAETSRAVGIMEGHLSCLRQGLFEGIFAGRAANPAFQLETVLELIVARLRMDYTPPRFLDCYAEFMRGLAWTNESTMEELAARYRQASEDYFQPFIRRHEHVFENYLINYIFRTVFPYRHKQADQTFVIDSGRESMSSAFLLLAAHYAIVRTLLIGMAALHRHDLSFDHAVRLVQSYSKAFQHSSLFETTVIESLNKSAECSTHGVAALVMD
jgi:lysine-N-methylase